MRDIPLYDTHLHVQDPRFDAHQKQWITELDGSGLVECIVNGTSPNDWNQVSEVSKHKKIRPAFGLHPWKLDEMSDDWFENLQSKLQSHRGAVIGEIGLDKWIRDPQFERQIEIFRQQLKLASALDLPPTIHCLKAWGHMLSILEKYHTLLPGFLLHSYSGPIEMVENFLELGAYFSISGYFAKPEKKNKLEAWKRIPLDRILIETDAPDMLPPPELQMRPIADKEHHPLNHPANIESIYSWASEWFGFSKVDEFARQIESNYRRLFGRR